MPIIAVKMLDYVSSFDFEYIKDVNLVYEKLLKIGQGTFGEVFKARCRKTGRLYALKKILMENEKEGFPITALREIKMLQKLRHKNITELTDICSEKSNKQRFSFYLVFTFCDHDLAGLLSQQNVKMRLIDIKTMIKHILTGLHKIHSSNILHRDMKAANVLITNEGVLKLADFGLARPMYRDNSGACYTNRVVTLWYRPPELLLGTRNYGPAIDIWGAGCIMAELWIRSPILQGESETNQLVLISQLCGSINTAVWPDVDKLPYFSKMELPQNHPRRLRERIRSYLHNNDQAMNVLDVMLTLNPAQRPSADQLLDHHFFYEMPRPLDNIKDLLSQLKTNMFEYTAGCGAHANRNRAGPADHQQQRQQPMQPSHYQQQQSSTHRGGPNQSMGRGGMGHPSGHARPYGQQPISAGSGGGPMMNGRGGGMSHSHQQQPSSSSSYYGHQQQRHPPPAGHHHQQSQQPHHYMHPQQPQSSHGGSNAHPPGHHGGGGGGGHFGPRDNRDHRGQGGGSYHHGSSGHHRNTATHPHPYQRPAHPYHRSSGGGGGGGGQR